MDEREYERLAAAAFRRIGDLFEDVDPDLADLESAGDVLRIDFADGRCIVLNTQRPARQLWMAGGKSAWHFDYDVASGRWLDAKDARVELFAKLAELVASHAGVQLAV
jgi:CyaY protein